MIGPRVAHSLREICTWCVLASLVAGAAGFAWLTRHPEAPAVASAAEWPVVGAAARRFQARWLPPPGGVAVGTAPAGELSVTRTWIPVREVEVEDFFELPPRRESPRAMAWSDSFEPWHGDGSPPLGTDAAPVLPLPGRRADPDRVVEALGFFADPPVASRLGPYSLFTDVDDPAVLAAMARAAEEAEPLYLSRYGLPLRGGAAETIFLYRREVDYRALQARSERIRGLSSRGHVGWGLVALYAGEGRAAQAVAPVLRHELAHLLNRRALGPALPPWLDEGIADDLAAFELDASLAPLESPLESLRTVEGERYELRGALAGLERLAAAIATGSAPPLPSLIELDWTTFVTEPAAALHYAASAWLVRYLLDEASGHRLAFRAFLRRVSRGGGVGASDLEAALARPWPEVEEAWRRYVAARASAAGVGFAPPAG